MLALQKALDSTDLHHLRVFNMTYYIITRNVFAKVGTGFFTHDNAMTKLDLIFAQYYFNVLKAYSDGTKTTPAWEIGFDFCKADRSIPLIYLAQGVNAHVNNDLGMALFDTVKEVYFKKDFDKVNPVIYESLDEVISETNLQKFYKPYMKLLIYHWRNNAWNNFIALQKKTKTKKDIEKKAERIGNDLANVRNIHDFYRLYRFGL